MDIKQNNVLYIQDIFNIITYFLEICDTYSIVRKISKHFNNIKIKIPKLDCSEKQFRKKSLVDILGQLKNVEIEEIIDFNHLSDVKDLKILSNVKKLDLIDSENINNNIIKNIGENLKQVTKLDIFSPNMTNFSKLMINFANLTELKYTSYDDKTFNLNHIKHLPLKALYLYLPNNKDINFKNIYIPTLTKLDLSCCNVSDNSLIDIKKMPIKHLCLEENNITDDGIKNILGLKLESLIISYTKISEKSFDYFENFSLTTLEISHNENIKNDLENLKNKKINSLDIRSLSISNKCVNYIVTIPLRSLNISRTEIDDDWLKEFTDKKHIILKNLKILNISHTKITNKYINNLEIFNLKSLDIAGLSINDFKFLEKHKLEYLDCSYNDFLDSDIFYLNKSIRCLNISNTEITNSGLNDLCENLSNLIYLDISKCSNLQQGFGKYLTKTKINSLDINHVDICDKDIKNLFNLKLKFLYIKTNVPVNIYYDLLMMKTLNDTRIY
jgi:hypothetical protein